jgi:predicted  nucleic acid-binding Zn-ribbon protein
VSVGRQLLEELRRDEELRRMLAEELIPEALRHRELRRTMLVALSREMATKDDIGSVKEEIDNLRKEINSRLASLENRVSMLEMRMSRIEGQLSLLVKIFLVFNASILIGIIGILLKSYVP